MGYLGRDDESSGSFQFAWVHSGALSYRRVHSRSRGLTPSRLGVTLADSLFHSGGLNGLRVHSVWR